MIEWFLKLQIIISSMITIGLIFAISIFSFESTNYLDKNFSFGWFTPAFIASLGCLSGMLIGLSTDYYTSNSH